MKNNPNILCLIATSTIKLNAFMRFDGFLQFIILVPLIAEHIYSFMVKDKKDIDLWISLSRHRTPKGTNKIVDKGIEFDQVDRERDWDDQIMFSAILFYWGKKYVLEGSHVPYWRLDGVIITILLQAGPVEFLYFWLHRALHHHYLYSRYHSHHHSFIVTEPITSVIHPFAEHIAYFLLFAIPVFTMVLTGAVSVIALAAYVTYLDFMNNMGHSNFELIPNWLFTLLLPLKYIIYTPSFHSPHHVQFKTYYSLFMPFYDYIYGTMDKSSDILYEKSLRRKEESPHVAHLTHLATPESINHLRLGFAPFAFKPYTPSTWHMWFFWPVTPCSMMLTWIYCSTFVVERYRFHNIRLQTSAIPKYNIQLKQSINNLIEEAILEHPQLKVKLVDGSSLAVTVVLNSIPKGTTQVVLRGKLTKVACALAFALCQKRIQVFVLHEDEYEKLDKLLGTKSEGKLVLSKSYTCKTWLVRDGLSEVEQRKASKRTLFIPFSQFPPKQLRTDCFYHTTLMQYYHTLAMQIPLAFENVDSCELSRRVMSIWCIAGLVHALEGWEEHKCGYTTSNIEKLLRFSTHLKS
ncbi:hypothetical protein V6Z12_A05G370900 [Gossypium hirsutum]